MFRPLTGLFRLVRRRPVFTLIFLALLVLAVAPLGLHYWALSHYRAAEQALQEDCLDDARDHLDDCLTIWPYSSATHLLAARVARLAGDYPRAEAQLDECNRLQKEPGLETHLEALLVRAEKGEVDDLERDLVLTSNRDEAQARLILEALGRAKLNLLNYRAAEYYFGRCLDRYPNDVGALDGRGLVRERMAAKEDAVRDYRRALDLSHGRSDARFRLAALYLDDSDTEAAEPLLKALRAEHPDRVEVQRDWARCQFLEGKTRESQRQLDALLAAHPDDYAALTLRGKIALEDGQPAEAEGYFRRALKQDRSESTLYFSLYDSLRGQQGREADAEDVLAENRRVQADYRRLQSLLTEELPKSGESADVLAEIGALCLRLDRQEMGAHWLLAALKKDPTCKPAHAALADYYEKKGDAAEAQRHRFQAD